MIMSNKYYKKQPYDNDLYGKSKNKKLVEHNELVETDVVFEPPKKDAVVDVLEVSNGVGLFSAEVTYDDFALVKGYIYKSIMYTTTKKEELDKFDNFQREQMGINEDDLEVYEEVYSPDASSSNRGLYRGTDHDGKKEEDKDAEEARSQDAEESKEHDGKDKDGKDKDGKDKDGKDKDGKDKDGKGKDGKDKDGKGKDKKDERNYVAIDGVVRHTTLSIPFEASIYIAGVTKNDELIAELELVKNTEGKEIIMESERIKGLKETDVVKISVTVK